MIYMTITTTFIATLLAVSPPAPAPDSPRKVHINVDAAELGSEGEGMDGFIIENLAPKLQEAGFEIVDQSDVEDGTIQLLVRFEALRKEKFDFGVHFEFIDGDEAKEATSWFACMGCSDAVLLPLLDKKTPALIKALEDRATANSHEADNPNGNPPENGHDDPPVGPKPKRIGPIGYVGIGVLALGAGGIIWGVVDLSRGQVYDQADTDEPRRMWTDYTPRGRVWLGVGIGGAAVGGALLITDLVIRSKKRKQHEKPTGTLVPLVPTRGVGLGWIQRF